jgi:hypothetical protein
MVKSVLAVVLGAALASGCAGDGVIDVQWAFYQFSQGFCAGGNVHNADVGQGKITNTNTKSASPGAGATGATVVNSTAAAQSPYLVPDTSRRLRALSSTSTSSSCSESDSPCQQLSSQYFWCNYQNLNCMSRYMGKSDELYTDVKTQDSSDAFMYVQYFDNNTTKTQTSQFQRQETMTNSYTWTFSETINAGMSESITAGVPATMKETTTFSLSVSDSLGLAQTSTTESLWSVSQTISIPPMSTVKLVWAVATTTTTGNYQATMVLPDYARVWCSDKTEGHNEWFVQAPAFMPLYYPSQCSGNICNINGPFTGIEGVSSNVQLSTCPLGVQC